MTDLSTLLSRVESGSGADRELDARVALWFKDGINDQLLYTDEQVAELVDLSESRAVTCADCGHEYTTAWVDVRDYTTDLNAVIGLVEAKRPDAEWCVWSQDGKYAADLNAEGDPILSGLCDTPARALLAALIRAEMEKVK